jgi:hypothetical protein
MLAFQEELLQDGIEWSEGWMIIRWAEAGGPRWGVWYISTSIPHPGYPDTLSAGEKEVKYSLFSTRRTRYFYGGKIFVFYPFTLHTVLNYTTSANFDVISSSFLINPISHQSFIMKYWKRH